MHNPLISTILELLHQHPHGMSEYEIFKRLGEHEGFSNIGHQGSLPLFQKHFMIMNGLYQLQQSLWDEEHLALDISPLKIFIARPTTEGDAIHPAIAESIELRLYYLDWSNLVETTEEDVIALHQNFWDRLNYDEGRNTALATLDLDEGASSTEIRTRYKKLAAEHHPDRGGNRNQFIEIRKAYELLKTFL
ncbi:MAG: DnaJ domain-containing protein [Chromatiales bacterium]|nr:DnaJ domain-containing protein [Chromatiales bacterium]